MAAFAGELLALAGPLDPSAIAFKPACAPHTYTRHLSGSSQPPSVQDGSASSSLLTMLVAALQLMADYLVDPDVLVIRSAQFTLRNLLGTDLGRQAFMQLDPVTQGYLQVCPPACLHFLGRCHTTVALSACRDGKQTILTALYEPPLSLSVHPIWITDRTLNDCTSTGESCGLEVCGWDVKFTC